MKGLIPRQTRSLIAVLSVVAAAVVLSSSIALSLFAGEQSAIKPTVLTTGYRVVKKFVIPGEGGTRIAVDPMGRRLYVSGDKIQVLNAETGKIEGGIAASGAFGVTFAPELHRGFASNGRDDTTLTVFDTDTLAVLKTVTLESGSNGILYDPFTKRVFAINKRITALDADSGKIVGSVDLKAGPEGAATTDGKGTIYVNEEDTASVAVVDAKSLRVTKEYRVEGCEGPRSVSYDSDSNRLLVGCLNAKLVLLDATTGKTAYSTLMCAGVGSGGLDRENKLVFESCLEGVISVIQEFTPDNARIIETIPTQFYAQTMAFDPITKNIYTSTQDVDWIPNSDPGIPPTRHFKPGSIDVLVLSRN